MGGDRAVPGQAILIVDGNNIAMRAGSIIEDSKWLDSGADGIPITSLQNMLNKRIREMKDYDGYEDVRPLITFDVGKGSSTISDAKINRWDYYNNYKANRVDDHTDPWKTKIRHEQSKWKDKWLASLQDEGHAVCYHPNVEADDFMSLTADLVYHHTNGKTTAAIWTMDKDLMQCVSDDHNVIMYRKRGHDEVYVNEDEVIREKGVPASKIRALLALQGDAADDYKGVSMYGGKRGLKVVNSSNGTYQDLLDKLMVDEKDRLAKKIKNGEINWNEFSDSVEAQLKRNWDLAGCGRDYMPSSAVIGAEMSVNYALDEDQNWEAW